MKSPLPEKILGEIKLKGIAPRPRWQFLLKRWVLWSLSLFSAVLGGIAVAIIIFLFVDHDYGVRVYLSQSAVEDILSTIPYFWLFTLTILLGVTEYAVRHTQFGYRYAQARIITAVFFGSIILGVLLNSFDAGERIQNLLIETVPSYDALVYTSRDSWSHPEKGLLGGTVISVIDSKEFEFLDFHQKVWHINTNEMQDNSDVIINKGSMFKIIGSQDGVASFAAGQILPWNN